MQLGKLIEREHKSISENERSVLSLNGVQGNGKIQEH